MKKYILIGSHGNPVIDRSHIKGMVHGVYDFIVKHSLEEAEKFVSDLSGIDYHVLFNMNILDSKKVHESLLLKKLTQEKRATLSYVH